MFGRRATRAVWEDSLYLARSVPPICNQNRKHAELFGADLERVGSEFLGRGYDMGAATAALHLGILWALRGQWHSRSDVSPWEMASVALAAAADTYTRHFDDELADACQEAAAAAIRGRTAEVLVLTGHSQGSLARFVSQILARESKPAAYGEFLSRARYDDRIDRAMAAHLMYMIYEGVC